MCRIRRSPLQICPSRDSPRQVITGTVILAKHPVSHPGDVRLAQAIDARGPYRGVLASYVNVLVFSQKGSRPLPNMLSGSDLVRSTLGCVIACPIAPSMITNDSSILIVIK